MRVALIAIASIALAVFALCELGLVSPNPCVSDLLFHSEYLQTAEQVLDEASRYRPFAMPAPND